MNLILSVFEETNMLDFKRTSLDFINKYEPEHGSGLYFFLYSGSSIPYFIGAAKEMFSRVNAHIAGYNNEGCWLPFKPEKLVHLSCFWEEVTPTNFFGPDFNNFNEKDCGEVINKILQHTQILFANIKPMQKGKKPAVKIADKMIYNVETLLNNNLAARMGLIRNWVGDGGMSMDIGRNLRIGDNSEKLNESIRLNIEYAIEPTQKMNAALLI